MKTKPTRISDLILSHITDSYVHYHRLPECLLKGISLVMSILKIAAESYKEMHGKTPILFLNGADLLAKDKEDLFI